MENGAENKNVGDNKHPIFFLISQPDYTGEITVYHKNGDALQKQSEMYITLLRISSERACIIEMIYETQNLYVESTLLIQKTTKKESP